MARAEFEEEIALSEFTAPLATHEGARLRKRATASPMGELTWEIDEFSTDRCQ